MEQLHDKLTGCLVIGFLIAALVDRTHAPSWLRLGLTMGVVGGYTTFSTYAQETLDLVKEGDRLVASTYAIGSIALGLAAVQLGAVIGRAL